MAAEPAAVYHRGRPSKGRPASMPERGILGSRSSRKCCSAAILMHRLAPLPALLFRGRFRFLQSRKAPAPFRPQCLPTEVLTGTLHLVGGTFALSGRLAVSTASGMEGTCLQGRKIHPPSETPHPHMLWCCSSSAWGAVGGGVGASMKAKSRTKEDARFARNNTATCRLVMCALPTHSL
jgi:hypothetical protein